MNCLMCQALAQRDFYWKNGPNPIKTVTLCPSCAKVEYSAATHLGYQVYCSECVVRPSERFKDGYPVCAVCLTHNAPTSAVRCECGAEKCKLPIHSMWCPKAEK